MTGILGLNRSNFKLGPNGSNFKLGPNGSIFKFGPMAAKHKHSINTSLNGLILKVMYLNLAKADLKLPSNFSAIREVSLIQDFVYSSKFSDCLQIGNSFSDSLTRSALFKISKCGLT